MTIKLIYLAHLSDVEILKPYHLQDLENHGDYALKVQMEGTVLGWSSPYSLADWEWPGQPFWVIG